MTSTIDPTKPITGNPTTESVRDNFQAAKDEIENLQSLVADISFDISPFTIGPAVSDPDNGGDIFAASGKYITIYTPEALGGSGDIYVNTGSGSDDSGAIIIRTGESSAGNSGSITLRTGPASGIRGGTYVYGDLNVVDGGSLTLDHAPTVDLHAATKKYVDDSIPTGVLDASGTPTAGQLAFWTDANTLAGQTMSGDATIDSSGTLSLTVTPITRSNTPSSGQIPLWTSATALSGKTMSGDATINSGGTITVGKSNGSTFGTAAFINTGTVGSTVPLLNAVNSWGAAQRSVPVALTSGTTITPDFSLGNHFTLALAHNGVLANPTNLVAGQSGVIVITQTAGSNTLTYGSSWKWSNGTAPTLSTTAGAIDVVNYFVNSGTVILAGFKGTFS